MLDLLMPRYDFAERHHRLIAATPDAVWDALTRLTLRDLSLTGPLVALRHPGSRPTPGPLLTEGPLPLLFVDEGRYALGGTVARPWRRRPEHRPVRDVGEVVDFDEAGWTKYLTDFRLTATDEGCVLSTETRGVSTDTGARRRFAAYWALIRIPSGLVRRDLLRSIAQMTEISAADRASCSP